jgi:hypothetical protein
VEKIRREHRIILKDNGDRHLAVHDVLPAVEVAERTADNWSGSIAAI